MSVSSLEVVPRADARSSHRLVVAWQHPVTRALGPVGMLTVAGGTFTFAYLRRAVDVDGFQQLLGFPDWDGCYESERLFPLFAQRVMSPHRPDYARYLHSLGLSTEAGAWAIMGRSQGAREGDGIRLFPEPVVDHEGRTTSTFFVNGLRHRMAQDPSVAPSLANLRVGQELLIVEERDNPVDHRALLVVADTGVALAWVPSLLLDYVHEVRATDDAEFRVEAVNGEDVPPGYRLLVTLEGRLPVGFQPFSGPDWELRGVRSKVG